MKLFFCFLFSLSMLHSAADTLDLSGQWGFAIDPLNAGITDRWYNQILPESLRLPGSLQEQGFGDIPSATTEWTSGIGMTLLSDPRFADAIHGTPFRCPFWLTPERHYSGPAWYQRDIAIPEEWANQQILFTLERPHWQTTLWIDQNKLGSQDSLAVPHRYNLSKWVRPGQIHRLTLRIDNRYIIPVGKDAHSISDQTQSNWNGVTGAIQLETHPLVFIEDAQVYPNLKEKKVSVYVKLANPGGKPGEGTLTLAAQSTTNPSHPAPAAQTIPIQWSETGVEARYTYKMGPDPLRWDEITPHLYTLTLTLRQGESTTDHPVSFGMRELGIAGTQFTLNGKTIFLRGTLECCIFPQHGYPPTDEKEWRRLIQIAKSYGLNHFRFHSWCPPRAAFAAADAEGFYFQVEGSCWAAFGDDTPVDAWIYEESQRILTEYGNHPSFLFYSPSNEPGGKNRDAFLGTLVTHLKQLDPRHYYTAGTGWPQIPQNQFHIQYATRLQNWPTLKFDQPPQTWDDYRTYVEKLTIPTISHEIGQWCVYPDLEEDQRYTGVLKAHNIAIFRDKLEKAGMGHLGKEFLLASGKFQSLLYKQEIETALRTPGFAGFQLLDLHDFPGQGTAPVGVLNALWENKGYIRDTEYRQFCNAVVPLLRMKKREFINIEAFRGLIEIANYSGRDLANQTIICQIHTLDGATLYHQEFSPVPIPSGGLTSIGIASVPLNSVTQAVQATITLTVNPAGYTNRWDIWVYPAMETPTPPEDLIVTTDWREALHQLEAGANVLLVPTTSTINSDTLGTFQPIFWNRITFPQQKVHTLGTLNDTAHPALAAFPTQRHTSWQWQTLLDHSKPIVMDTLPKELHPIVQPIDDWNDCRKLGLLFEATVGQGKLLVCAMDVIHDLNTRPAAKQLYASLLRYTASEQFQPPVPIPAAQFKALFKEPSVLQKLGAEIQSDSEESGYAARNAIDENPQTLWHTRWTPTSEPHPHFLQVDLKEPQMIQGLAYLPRQDQANGRIARYEVRISADGETWSEPIASGEWENNAERKTIQLAEPVQARWIRIIALTEVNGNPFASAAEIEILTPAPKE